MSEPKPTEAVAEVIDFNKAKQRKLLEDMVFRQQELENIFADLGVENLQYLKDVLENVEATLDEPKKSNDPTT